MSLFHVSPGVEIKESDLTLIVPAVSTAIGAIAGDFQWGPVGDIINITDKRDLVDTFGEPNEENFEDFFTAHSFLEYSSNLRVIRLKQEGAYNATAGGTNSPVSELFIGNNKDFETQLEDTGDDGTLQSFTLNQGFFAARYPGERGNGLKIAYCLADKDSFYNWKDDKNDTEHPISYYLYFSGPPGTSNYCANRDVRNDEMHIMVLDDDGSVTGIPGTILERFEYVSMCPDALYDSGASSYVGNVLRDRSRWIYWINNDEKLEGSHAGRSLRWVKQNTPVVEAQVYDEGELVTRRVHYYYNPADFVTTEMTTEDVPATAVLNTSGLDFDTLITDTGMTLTDFDYDLDTSSPSSNSVETLRAALENTSAIESAVIDSSDNIEITFSLENAPDGVEFGVVDGNGVAQFIASGDINKIPVEVTIPDDATKIYFFEGGYNGITSDLANKMNGYIPFTNVTQVDVSLIMAGKMPRNFADAVTYANYLISLAWTRKDAIALVSPPTFGSFGSAFYKDARRAVEFTDQLVSSSYGVIDSCAIRVYDQYHSVYRWIPANGVVAGLCANADAVADPWWSPAGYNRGQLRNISRISYNPDKMDRDDLYKARINPIVQFPGEGTVLYGDKTLLARPSAFDRINVRRLFIVLQKAISTMAKYMLFEFNDEFTRARFVNIVNPYLRSVKGRRGITDYQVVCDERNNLPSIIDANEFVADIYIKPARSINFIQLHFIATPTGANFEEVITGMSNGTI